MTRQHKPFATTSAGPHAGQDSIRQAYDAMGPQAFYSMHGERYTNPHEGQVYRALAALLDATPAAVWLGHASMDAPAAVAHGSGPHGDAQQYDSSDDEDEQEEYVGSPAGADDHAGGREHTGGSSSTTAASTPAAGGAQAPGASHAITPAPNPHPEPSESQAVWRHVTRGIAAPAPLRVLDLACGSGEVTVSLEAWNAHRSVTPAEAAAAAAAAAATASGTTTSGAAQNERTAGPPAHTCPHTASATTRSGQQPGPRGKGKQQQQQQLVPPYRLYITACDPYTGQAYLARTGRAALPWSFEDVAAGCLEGHVATTPGSSHTPSSTTHAPSTPGQRSKRQAQPQQQQQQQQYRSTLQHHLEAPSAAANDPRVPFDLVVCSFALHLCEPSRLFATLHALSLSARWLLVLAPHKRPVVLPQHGWARVAATKTDRTHLRVYRSLNVVEAGTLIGTGG